DCISLTDSWLLPILGRRLRFQKCGADDENCDVTSVMSDHHRLQAVLAVEIAKGDSGDSVKRQRGKNHQWSNGHEERSRGKMTKTEDYRCRNIGKPDSGIR